VLDDVLDDHVSVDAARERYGVVIAGVEPDFSVDLAATERVRRERRTPP
jgi:hypothetical protein